jgi:hypothetical protein
MLGVLDAIVQMDGTIPPEEAAILYPTFPVQALIFLARGRPAASRVLLNIFEEQTRRKPAVPAGAPLVADGLAEDAQEVDAWLTAGHLLMNIKPAGFAAAVFADLAVNAQVRVVDDGSGGRLGGGIGSSCSGGGLPSWPGWPPVGNYRFAGPGSVVLANGADPSFYERVVGGALPSDNERACGWRRSRDLVSEHFLATLAGEPVGDSTVRASVKRTITWKDDEQYLKDLRAFIDLQQDAIDTLGAKLMAAGLLSAEERRLVRPSLQVWISDERTKTLSSLPTLQNAETNVKIVN